MFTTEKRELVGRIGKRLLVSVAPNAGDSTVVMTDG